MSLFAQQFEAAREANAPEAVIALIPYARLIGMRFAQTETGLIFELPFQAANIGNPLLPALHGGVIGGFLEHAAILHLMWSHTSIENPKTIDFSLDYLRSGRPKAVYARCDITRQGKRVAHVTAEAWQDSPDKPIAVARAHFMLM